MGQVWEESGVAVRPDSVRFVSSQVAPHASPTTCVVHSRILSQSSAAGRDSRAAVRPLAAAAQTWPFPRSLMVGFRAEAVEPADGGRAGPDGLPAVVVDPEEMDDVRSPTHARTCPVSCSWGNSRRRHLASPWPRCCTNLVPIAARLSSRMAAR